MKNKIIIVAGDPNSINSEILYKTWKKINRKIRNEIILIGNYELILRQFKILNVKIKILKISNINDQENSNKLKILNIPLKFTDPFKVKYSNASKYVLESLDLAHNLSKSKKILGFINCPVNKKLLNFKKNIGVTEYLAAKCKIKDDREVMLIYNKKFSVTPLTTHINIRDVSKNITTNKIVKKISTLHKYFKILFKKEPKIGVLGLNPHNAEMSKYSEEITKIIPALSILKKRGFSIKGPLVSDTIFINNYKKYDVILGMYHDQVLSPFKTLYAFDAINITLGLSYYRMSPDHGPAEDLILKNKANPTSLLQCIKFINSLIL